MVMLCDSKYILGVGEEIHSNDKQRWKFLVLHGISRQPIVGACHPAPTLISIFHSRRAHTDMLQRAGGKRGEKRGEEGRRGADTL